LLIKGEINMKKMAIMMIALGFMLIPVSAVIAGGDKNRGETGAGYTNENGCEAQPCFDNAPKPGSSIALVTATSDPTSGLDITEAEYLVFIREEEKLARDVYRVLYERWGIPVFTNIIESEEAHMDAMANLLAFYGIADPITDDTTGVFTDEDIGALFIELTQRGLASESEALLVGGFIEEYDILDIWDAYDNTDEERIRRVYQNLYEGSYNHLHAFVYNYELLTGEAYEPELLSEPEFDLVMDFDTQAKQAQEPKQQKGK
jgi:hypothetical protein